MPKKPENHAAYKVEPIRSLQQVKRIRKMLLQKGELRNALLFCLGVNNGLRIGDLLNLKVYQVKDLDPDREFHILEQKTGKKNIAVVNQICHKILLEYLENTKLTNGNYLFPSQKPNKNGEKKLDPRSVNALIKKWTQEAGLKGNYGTHSLRKTFGYIQYTEFKADLSLLCKRFNHSSPAITLRYIGITDDQIRNMLLQQI